MSLSILLSQKEVGGRPIMELGILETFGNGNCADNPTTTVSLNKYLSVPSSLLLIPTSLMISLVVFIHRHLKLVRIELFVDTRYACIGVNPFLFGCYLVWLYHDFLLSLDII
jgi:hypothetical protein